MDKSKLIRMARISDCRKYRYSLRRIWDDKLPCFGVCMLNPSTADDKFDDNTVRRLYGFAEDWGYGSFELVNLFAYRATDPKELLKVEDPVGPENDNCIIACAGNAGGMLVAWGVHGWIRRRCDEVNTLLETHAWFLFCLGYTADGQPKHPLRLARSTPTIPYPKRKPHERQRSPRRPAQ